MKKLCSLIISLSILFPGSQLFALDSTRADTNIAQNEMTETTPGDENVSAESPSAESVTDETVPSETSPAESTPVETVPEETVASEDYPVETTPEEIPAETTPEETVPAAATPDESYPAEITPEETAPAEITPADTATENVDTAVKEPVKPEPTKTPVIKIISMADEKTKLQEIFGLLSYGINVGLSMVNFLNYDVNGMYISDNNGSFPIDDNLSNSFIMGGYSLGFEVLYNDFQFEGIENRFKNIGFGLGISYIYVQDYNKFRDSNSTDINTINEFYDLRLYSMWSAFMPVYLAVKSYYNDNSSSTPYIVFHLGYNYYFRESGLYFNQITDPGFGISTNSSYTESTSGGFYYGLGVGYLFSPQILFELMYSVNNGSFSGRYTSYDQNNNYIVKYSSDVKYSKFIVTAGYLF